MCWSADAIQLEQFCILSHALVKRVRVNSRNSLAREMYALLYKFAKKMFVVAPSETQVRRGCPHLAKHRCPECPHAQKF
jgi:hypothetical protein